MRPFPPESTGITPGPPGSSLATTRVAPESADSSRPQRERSAPPTEEIQP